MNFQSAAPGDLSDKLPVFMGGSRGGERGRRLHRGECGVGAVMGKGAKERGDH